MNKAKDECTSAISALWVLAKPPNLLSIPSNSNFRHLFVLFYFHS